MESMEEMSVQGLVSFARKSLETDNVARAAKAIALARRMDATNVSVLETNATVLRRLGLYSEAAREVLAARCQASKKAVEEDDVALAELTKLTERDAERTGRGGGDRSKREVRQWVEILKGTRYFKALHDREVASRGGIVAEGGGLLEEVARRARCARTAANKVIFRQGDRGDAFYVIYRGIVAITKVVDVSTGKSDVVLKRLKMGDGFGEVALEDDKARRTADARTETACVLLTLAKVDYCRITQQLRDLEVGERTRWLSRCAQFSRVCDLESIARRVTVKLYDASSIILRQNEEIPELSVVKSGVVDVYKEVSGAECVASPRDKSHRPSTPEAWVLQRSWKDVEAHYPVHPSRVFPVGVLGRGQLFGETAVLEPGGRAPVTVVALTAVVLYTLSTEAIADLGLNFHVAFSRALDRSLGLYNPPHAKLAQYERDRTSWNEAKDGILASVMSSHWIQARRRTLAALGAPRTRVSTRSRAALPAPAKLTRQHTLEFKTVSNKWTQRLLATLPRHPSGHRRRRACSSS